MVCAIPLAFLSGAQQGTIDGFWQLLLVVATAVTLLQWSQLDADELQMARPNAVTTLLLLLVCPGPMLVVPIYLFRTRGLARGLPAVLLAYVYFLVLAVISFAAWQIGLEVSAPG